METNNKVNELITLAINTIGEVMKLTKGSEIEPTLDEISLLLLSAKLGYIMEQNNCGTEEAIKLWAKDKETQKAKIVRIPTK